MTAPGIVLVHADEYAGWVFDSGHPTQGRRCTLAREMLLAAAHTAQVEVKEKQADFLPTREQLRSCTPAITSSGYSIRNQ